VTNLAREKSVLNRVAQWLRGFGVARWLFVTTAALLALAPIGAQQQQPSTPRSGWPCGARLDTSYFQVAEGTGGHLLLLAPEEIGDSAALLTALGSHHQTIFRLAGSVRPGIHEYQVPIDPSVESVVFSISSQCLQVAQVLRPSGLPASGDNVTDLSNFRAQRMVIIAKPEPGIWTIRISGSGVSGVVAQARGAIGISQLRFTPSGSATSSALPAAGVENVMKMQISGTFTELRASLVSGQFQKIADLQLERGDTEGSYVSRFTPGAQGFRVLIAGKDAEGAAFQRMHATLLTPAR
jgi:hypothetical protein